MWSWNHLSCCDYVILLRNLISHHLITFYQIFIYILFYPYCNVVVIKIIWLQLFTSILLSLPIILTYQLIPIGLLLSITSCYSTASLFVENWLSYIALLKSALAVISLQVRLLLINILFVGIRPFSIRSRCDLVLLL